MPRARWPVLLLPVVLLLRATSPMAVFALPSSVPAVEVLSERASKPTATLCQPSVLSRSAPWPMAVLPASLVLSWRAADQYL